MIRAGTFCDYIGQENKIWFSDINANALVEYDLKGKIGKIIAVFQNESIKQKCLHKRMLLWNDSLYFFPELGKYISIYNLVTKKMESISVFIEGTSRKGKTKISGIVQIDSTVWIFPQFIYQPLLRFDLLTNEIKAIHEWNDMVRPYIKSEEKPFAINIEYDGEKVWIPIRETSYIIDVDLRTMGVNAHEIQLNNVENYMLTKIDNEFWVTQVHGGKIIKVQENGVAEIYETSTISNDFVMPFSKVVYNMGKYYALPSYYNKLGIIDKQTKRIELKDLPNEKISTEDSEKKLWPIFQEYCVSNGRIYAFSLRADSVLIIDDKENIDFGQLLINTEISKEVKRRYLENSTIEGWLIEGQIFSLQDYLDVNVEKVLKEIDCAETSGKLIHKEIMKNS